jgi:hypothetical protein
MMSRVLLDGVFSGNSLIVGDISYDAKLNSRILEVVNNENLDLSIERTYICVPHTLPENKQYSNEDREQEPYLRFTIIGIVVNQPNASKNIVNITGKVIYENVNHKFVLVKIQRGGNYEIIKLKGIIEDTIKNNRGGAVDKMFDILAVIENKSLIIEDAWYINTNVSSYHKETFKSNVIPFPTKNYLKAA